jgi:sodium transport system ATP-binding protein
VIEVRGIARRFVQGQGRSARAVQAVDGLDWVAGDGCISGLLGPNGAGKTTLLRIVAGLLEPDAGQVLVDGIDVATQRRPALARLGVLSDARGLYPRLTALENIVYYGRLHGLSLATAEARAQSLARTLQMEPLLQRRTEGFSQGERMKTALARALVHDPHNIILDEPTNGLDVPATRALREALRRLRDEHGKCIVFSTHLMQEVERLCDQVLVMARGRAVAQGTVAELCARTGQDDFERCFVQLAFGSAADAAEAVR